MPWHRTLSSVRPASAFSSPESKAQVCYRVHTSVRYGGGFVNKIKKAVLEVFVLLLKMYSFFLSKVYIFSKAE